MGHLVNPISRQIKYYASWKVTSNQYLRKDFSYFFFIDQYIKNVINSIMYLKSFFNKFFFYDINYFLKDNTLVFFFSFKIIRKTSFKFYWNYRYPFYLFSNYPNFKKKSRAQRDFQKSYLKSQEISKNAPKKQKYFEKNHSMKYSILSRLISLKSNSGLSRILRKKAIFFKIKKFKFNFFKYKLFNKYLLNNLYLKKLNLNFLILKNIAFLRNIKTYGRTELLFTNNLADFGSAKLLLKKHCFAKSISQGLISQYVGDSLFKNERFDIRHRDFIFFNKAVIFVKNKALRFLKKFYMLSFKKFKLRPKLRRRYINLRIRKELSSLIRKTTLFSNNLISFISDIQKFTYSDVCKYNISAVNLEKIKKLIILKPVDTTKNHEVLGWLRVVLTHFG